MNGGIWLAEVKWEILKVNDNNTESSLSYISEVDHIPVARGGAPSICRFPVANKENGTFECQFCCQDDVTYVEHLGNATILPSQHMNEISLCVPLPVGESEPPKHSPIALDKLAPSTLEVRSVDTTNSTVS